MILQSITLHHFKNYESLQLDFSEGINAIIGSEPNDFSENCITVASFKKLPHMQNVIFIAGVIVSTLFFVGYWIYRKELKMYHKHQRKKKSNNEYRTNEEYINYPN